MITIVTSTLNAESSLELLVSSLRAQSDANFLWIVADGGSVDRTLDVLKNCKDIVTDVLEGPDHGIYHGLNRAIARVQTPYYLVLGADDTLDSDAILNFNKAASISNADFISARVRTSDGGELRPLRGSVFRYGHLAYISQHSVGTLIKTSLHKELGLYSKHYPIAADRHFVLNAIKNCGAVVEKLDCLVGTYSTGGTSNNRYYDTILDIFKVDYELSDQPFSTAVKSLIRYSLNLANMTSKKRR